MSWLDGCFFVAVSMMSSGTPAFETCVSPKARNVQDDGIEARAVRNAYHADDPLLVLTRYAYAVSAFRPVAVAVYCEASMPDVLLRTRSLNFAAYDLTVPEAVRTCSACPPTVVGVRHDTVCEVAGFAVGVMISENGPPAATAVVGATTDGPTSPNEVSRPTTRTRAVRRRRVMTVFRS